MKTKLEIIAELKLQNPTLRGGSDEAGYTDYTKAEYDAAIGQWAQNEFDAQTPPTIAEKLESVGLSIDDLKAALGL